MTSCSEGRAPCQTSAIVTGEQQGTTSLRPSLFQISRIARSRPRETSIKMSESIRMDFKLQFSEVDFPCGVYECRLRKAANRRGLSTSQQMLASNSDDWRK